MDIFEQYLLKYCTVLKYTFEVLVLYLNMFCHQWRAVHFMPGPSIGLQSSHNEIAIHNDLPI